MSKPHRRDRKQSPTQAPKPKKAGPKPAKTAKPKEESGELTMKQRAFVEHYLVTWNATEAARRAGYSAKTAYQSGYENMKKHEVAKLIEARIGELKMTTDEVLLRLAYQARSDIGDFVSAKGEIDLAAARRARRLHLVKKISNTDSGLTIELYSSQKALELIGRAQKLFVDVQEHSGTVNLNHDLDSAIEKAYGISGPSDSNTTQPA